MSVKSSTAPTPASMPAVLIAGGDADARASVRSVFDSHAYEIYESEDGAEALGKALCHRPGLIIAETHLPRINGLALCRLLRADPTTRETPIILIASAPSDAESIWNAGADHVLDKPCTPDKVRSAARVLLDRPRGAPRAAASSEPVETAGGRRADQRGFGIRSVRREQTNTPPRTPPPLICPMCQASLVYQHSHTGGVNARSAEQWDYYQCPSCGPYQYRHRTRKLKAT